MTLATRPLTLMSYDPVFRLAVKSLLDLALAALAWVFATCFLNRGLPYAFHYHVAQWAIVIFFINIFFQLPRQHYRLLGRRDLFRLAFATMAIIAVAMGFTFQSAWEEIQMKSGTIILAGLLTGIFWTLLRLGVA